MSIKNGPIKLEHIGENKYIFTSFPDELRGNLFFHHGNYHIRSNIWPACNNTNTLFCPGNDRVYDAMLVYIPPNIAKGFFKAIEACNRQHNLTSSHYIKRLPR